MPLEPNTTQSTITTTPAMRTTSSSPFNLFIATPPCHTRLRSSRHRQKPGGVDRVLNAGPSAVHLEVQMGSRRVAGRTLQADDVAGVHHRTVCDCHHEQVPVADEVALRTGVAGQLKLNLDDDVVS